MKRILTLLLLAAVPLLFAGGCSRHKIIPDNKLALIFRDAFLANAYVGTRAMKLDSLNLYEPIFAGYGYTTDDVQYTIGNFSKRKSARLGDVVEQAITMLEAEGLHYNHEVAILDTIDNVARRTFTRRIYTDSLIEVFKLADTARLRIEVADIQRGEYEVRIHYRIDSLDKNSNQRIATWFERADSSRTQHSSTVMRRNYDGDFSRRMRSDTSVRRLVIDLAANRSRDKRPHMTFRDVEVIYTPETADAVDCLYLKALDIRIFADEFLRAFAADSVALPLDAEGVH